MFQYTSTCAWGTQTDHLHLITNYRESPAKCNMHSIVCQTSDTQFQLFYILKEWVDEEGETDFFNIVI